MAATVGKAEKTSTGHHSRMGEVERNRCLCTGAVGGSYRRLWEEEEEEEEEGWCDMLT